jgi:hypothetical protein
MYYKNLDHVSCVAHDPTIRLSGWDTIINVTARFEILEHPADVGFLAYGATLEELFVNAALAMISIGGDIESVRETERREI